MAFPIGPFRRRGRSGVPDQLPGGKSIVEFPIASYRAWGKNWPIGGGGYHRLLPGSASRWFVRRVMQSRPFVFYCHPYEFDPHEFAEITVPIPLKVRLHQGLGRGRFESRFVSLINRFGGCRMVDLLHAHAWPDFQLDALLSAANV